MQHRFLLPLLALFCAIAQPLCAIERTILVGPKTIGPGWRDHITLEPRHFAEAQAGDILTVYVDHVKPWAQAALQRPDNSQPIAEGYAYFSIDQLFRLTLTEAMLPVLRTHGLRLAGHDYRICQATLCQAADFRETIVWRGPSVTMPADWSANAELPGRCFKTLQQGDAIRLHASHVESGAAAKLMDMTWNLLEPRTDGLPLGSDGLTYDVLDQAALIKLQLAGTADNTALRIGGRGYRLERVGIVQFVGTADTTLAQAQRAPREYALQANEAFRGERLFPNDWSENLRLTAERFQELTEDDVLVVSYTLLPEPPADGGAAQMAFRQNQGKWHDLTGAAAPNWYELDGSDVVVPLDPTALHHLKMRGLVLSGRGFVLRRVAILRTE